MKRNHSFRLWLALGSAAIVVGALALVGDAWTKYADGYDLLEWIAKQPWCNGRIGTFGGSALGITQLGMAGSGTTRLSAQVIHVGAPSLYHDTVFPGGVFKKAMI